MTAPSLRARLAHVYLGMDPRSLALFRIAMGLVLLADVARRVPDLASFYSNEGVIPNHTVLWRPPHPWMFSLFFTASRPGEAALGFVLCALAFLAFTLGWRTRLAHVASLIAAVSLHSRVMLIENSGSFTMGVFLLLTLPLPLGRRFSVDALLASLRLRRERGAEDLEDRAALPRPSAPVMTLGTLLVLLQLSVIYLFNALHKDGETWRSGAALHYVLHQDRIVTVLGLWARDHLPASFWRAATWGTLAVEGAAPLLLLAPVGWVWTRRIFIVALGALHVGVALFINLGLFSAVMIASYPLLLTHRDWALWDRWRRRGPRLDVYFDAACGICFQVARVLARLDGAGRLRLVANDRAEDLPPGVTPELVERTIVVVDPRSGRRWVRQDAFARIFAALPFGFLIAWPLRVPGLRAVAGWVYDAIAARRRPISEALGLAACGVPRPAPQASSEAAEVPAAAWLRRLGPAAREAALAFLMVLYGVELLVAEPFVPEWMRPSRPEWMEAAVVYPHTFQSWRMFAPEAPTFDQMVFVDAVTADGRHVDPLNLVASEKHGLPVTRIPERLGQSSFWCDYSLRIPEDGIYHDPLRDWILRHHERTGRPEDRIVSFEAFAVTDDSPPPGEREPRNVKIRSFYKHPPGP